MKTKSFLAIALLLFFSLTAFRSGNSATTTKTLLTTEYCGYISAGCTGSLTVRVGFYGSSPYLIGLYDNGVSIPVQVNSIATSPYQDNIFELDIEYTCYGSPVNYIGNAYCLVCE